MRCGCGPGYSRSQNQERSAITCPGQNKLVVVHIISTAYSGSTWINLILGSHPDSFSIGELKRLLRTGRADCSVHSPTCPVFSQFDPSSKENPFLQLQRLCGKNILIVNNSRKFLQAQADPRIESRFIHLVRDGRAVAASSLRKGTQPNMWRAARRWAHNVRRSLRLMRRLRPEPTYTLNYEKMVAEPQSQLRQLCQLVGIEPDESMLRYWEHDHHFLGGNRGTLLAMLKKQDHGAELPTPPPSSATGREANLEFYKRADPASFVDERWRQELSKADLRVFGLIAGRLNRAMGYDRK